MEVGKDKVELDPNLGIILIENPLKTITLDELIDIRDRFFKSTGKLYKYGILRRSPGYYFSYRLSDRKVICCGIMNKKECVNETREFARKN